jgi:Na+-translocating ferredoxin:NAD+ oxidoreductase RnfG subunit
VFGLFILANLPYAGLRLVKPDKALAPARATFRGAGYALFTAGLSVIICSNLLAYAGARLSPSLPLYAAQALAGDARIEQTSAVIEDKTVKYFEVYQSPADTNAPSPGSQTQYPTGYVFSSEDLAPEVRGFAGKINLGIHVDTAGELIGFHIIRSNETPAYLELLAEWQDGLKGRQLFQSAPFADVHTVSGATVSSEAVLAALEQSGRKFAEQVLGRTMQAGTQQRTLQAAYVPDTGAIYLMLAVVLTLIVIYRGGFWSRLAVLFFNLVAGGIILNAQYSTEQIATVLSLHAPAVKLSGAFLLALAVPLLVIDLGNIYCGYLCPFGAAQELLGYVVPRRFKQPITRDTMRPARFVKYIVLFVVIIVFFLSRNRTTLAADPLISIFNLRFSIYDLQPALLWIGGIALLGSVFYTRFWCRYLCPVGALLSLFNNVALLKHLLPAKKYGRCEFGLTGKDKMDCIYCDKCRYEAQIIPKQELARGVERSGVRWLGRYLVTTVVAAGLVVSAISLNKFLEALPSGRDYSAAFVASGGQPRDVDLQRVQTMIRQNKLSDREAEFYEKVE